MDVQISLFGKFEISCADTSLHSVGGAKPTELLGYLFLNRSRSHAREALATVMWKDRTTKRARTYLRKALWQLQNTLEGYSRLAESCALRVDDEWVALELGPDVWFDLAVFEETYGSVKGTSGEALSPAQVARLEKAVDLHTGDLLKNWYQQWCLEERSRLKRMYFRMLDKLVEYSLTHGRYDKGLEYGERILRLDPAREQTHRHLMGLRYLAGDRTGALRQYGDCVEALRTELDIHPSDATKHLYTRIKNSEDIWDTICRSSIKPVGTANPTLNDHIERMRHIRRILNSLEDQIQEEINAIDRLLDKND